MSDQERASKRLAPAGWYPDAEVDSGERYWDGQQWTERRRAKPAKRSISPASDWLSSRIQGVQERVTEELRATAHDIRIPAGNKEVAQKRAEASSRRAQRNEERAQRLKAERAERKAERDEQTIRKAEKRRASSVSLVLGSRLEFLGGTREIPGLVPGSNYGFTLGMEGLTVSLRGALLLKLPWSKVHDIEVDDATTVTQSTRVKHRSYGYAGGFTHSMPVPETRSDTFHASTMGIRSELGDFLFRVNGERPKDLEGRLMAIKHKWTSRDPESRRPDQDPVEDLRKLGELRDAGVITGSEFEAKKAELLRRI